MTKPIVVQLALSPAGYLHIDSGRAGVLSYLLARHNGAMFRICIEDTEVERSDASSVKPILNALRWLGCEWDGDIVHQSQRLDLYKEYTGKLLASGHAYRCFCTPQELETLRAKATAEGQTPRYSRKCCGLSADEVNARLARGDKFAVRVFMPEGETVYHDVVLGEIRRKNEDLDDFVVARSNGAPTNDFAMVIDGHDMGVTHIIRDYEHATNTFRQIILYRALGWEAPEFGHISVIQRPDKQKAPERAGDRDVLGYEKEGILPEALFNYLCLLGWSPKTDREIFTKQELIGMFTLPNFNSSDAVFDEEKLIAFNKAHILLKSDHDLAVLVAPMLVDAGFSTKYWLETRWVYLREVMSLLKERVDRVTDFAPLGRYFFYFDYRYDSQAEAQHFTLEAADLLEDLGARFAALGRFTPETTEVALSQLAKEKGLKEDKLVHLTRLAVSGMLVGPGLCDMLVTLSQPVVVERMKKAVDYIRSKKQF